MLLSGLLWCLLSSPPVRAVWNGQSRKLDTEPVTKQVADNNLEKITGKKLVFTSAGDNSEWVENWTGPGQNYDVFTVYYGKDEQRFQNYKANSKYCIKGHGSKMQNFFNLVFTNRNFIIDEYDYFFLLDDDITFRNGMSDINLMFDISHKHSLDITMPSFDNETSVISFNETIHKEDPKLLLTYTNFAELNSYLFSRKALTKFMNMYDPILLGWGCDILALCANGMERENAYAVVHAVVATNPPVRKETGVRELEAIPFWYDRKYVWDGVSYRLGCPRAIPYKEYSSIYVQQNVEHKQKKKHS
mmetsp:Transcript_30672/g.42721  ORF Transcript_30672/g.42721 Transcript_30672/m.42721 type:complete len:303 (-) Transcript_30672:122-1030(-)